MIKKKRIAWKMEKDKARERKKRIQEIREIDEKDDLQEKKRT